MATMSWINNRLPLLLTLTIVIFITLIFSFNKKIKAGFSDDKIIVNTELTFPASVSLEPTIIPSVEKLAAATTIPTNKPTVSDKPSTTTQDNNDTNGTNTTNITNATNAPATTTPVAPTTIPTSQPTTTPVEAVNIQIWVRGWQYNNNQQYAADGSVKIKKDGQEIASGSVNGDIIYKASNMPINSNLEVYFYFPNGCGQMKQISTGSNSALFQEDFSLSSSTTCL